MLLERKVAIVYGGAGGIGAEVARNFALEGATVFLAGRALSAVEAIASEIRATGGKAAAAAVDAADEVAVERHVADVMEAAGRIDVLFNAIGMADVQGQPLVDMPLAHVLQPVVVAMETQFATARAVGRRMSQQGSGVILTVTAEPTPAPNTGGFGAACSAIEGLWRSLAVELGPYGVRCIVVRSPGSPDTPAVDRIFKMHAETAGISSKDLVAAAGAGTLLRRLPTVAEIAGVATLMASDRASAMTAAMVNATCGALIDL